MSYPDSLTVSRGNASGLRNFYRFGIREIGSSYAPLISGNAVQLPAPSGAQALRAVSTSVNDDIAGTGGRKLFLQGLDAQGNEISDIIDLSGTTQTAYTTNEYWRLHDAILFASGTYSEDGLNSYDGTITISDSGSNEWALIENGGGFPSPAIWQSAFYTVPANKRAFIFDFAVGTDSTKLANYVIKYRQNANDETEPQSWIEANRLVGVDALFVRPLAYPFNGVQPFTDLGFWAQITQGTTGFASIGYGVILVDGLIYG